MELKALGGRATREAWERFRSGDADPETIGSLRPEVLASWQRSMDAGAGEDLSPPFLADYDSDSRVLRAARPVLGDLAERLAGTSLCIFLTDPNAQVLDRWLSDRGPSKKLRALASEPGFSFAESAVGTNAGSIVAEGRGANFVVGAEHFPSELHDMSCFAAPIKHPVTGQMVAILDITCLYRESNELIMPMALRAADDIADRLAAESTHRERLLIESFSQASRRSSRPIMTVNESMMISNPAAARLLGDIDQGLFWDEVSRALKDGRDCWHELSVLADEQLRTRCRPIADGGVVAGALVHFDKPSPPSPNSRRVADAELPGLVGRSSSWKRTVNEVRSAAREASRLLVLGGSGVGKTAVAHAFLELVGVDDIADVVDCALLSTDDGLDRARAALRTAEAVLLENVQAVPHHLDNDLSTSVSDACTRGVTLVATHLGELDSEHTSATVLALAGRSVHVSSLRDRREDIPELARAALRKEGRALRDVGQDAVRALMRVDWPGNVAQLRAVVLTAAAATPRTRIGLGDLPAEIGRAAAGRDLSAMERVEVDALRQALRDSGGDKTKAAGLLGISRSTLYRKLRRYRIDPDRQLF